ncbi:FAD-dependent oxidoreductase [Streptosporangium sp. NPDC002524]|uniref:FAD-dependent oxidoreductase n=1 Tax=Streptosporangium sp. NPDC002524 TaxID=3154537 RepID=UPI00331BE158
MRHRIIVLGAGYTGAIVAGRLARRLRREDVAITLVNAEPDFVERVRMHQLAAGQDLRPRPFGEMFAGTGVELRLAKVTAVDVDRKTVTVVGHKTVPDRETITDHKSVADRETVAEVGRKTVADRKTVTIDDRKTLPSADRKTITVTDRKTAPGADASGAEELAYDTLVYALGSGWDAQGVPGTAEHAYEIAGRPGALRLRERLARLGAGQRVVVVGGGLTGLEAAAEIAEARPDLDVALAARGDLGDWLSPKGREHLRRTFGKLGITVHERTAVTGVEAERVTTAGGKAVPAAVVVWTTGFAVHPIAKATALEVTGTGQIVVDRTMRSVSHPDVYAVGDAAMAMGPGDKPLRMSCASGTPTAWQAADAIAARLTGGRLPNAPIRYFNQCVSLGRREGLIQYVTADDRAVRTVLTGRLAAVYKELVCKGAAWGVGNPTLGLPTRRRRVTRERATAGPAVEARA